MSIYVRASLFRMKIMYFKIANRTLTAINLTPCIIHHTPMDVAKFFKTQLMVTLRLTHFLAHSYWYTLNLGFLNVHIRRMDRNYDLPAIDCSSLHLDLQLYNYIYEVCICRSSICRRLSTSTTVLLKSRQKSTW